MSIEIYHAVCNENGEIEKWQTWLQSTANTGGGGGGGRGQYNYSAGGSGGSGIVIIRNHRQD